MKASFLCVVMACQEQSSPESSQSTLQSPRVPVESSRPTELEPQPRPFIFSIELKDRTSVDIITGEGEFNYSVDWDNDGTYDESSVQGPVSHDYKEPGTYTIRIRGQFPHMLARDYENIGDSNLCGMKVLQWGDIQWKSMKRMFAWCGVVGPIFPDTDAPDLSHVTDMSFMFAVISEHLPFNPSFDSSSWRRPKTFDNVRLFNQPLNHWDVSNVTDMSFMFYQASAFNQPLNSWDVSNVTNMNSMFSDASVFNQPLNSWNTKNVITMGDMFNGAQDFNQPLDSWNVSHVTDMGSMFHSASVFNQPLNAWNTSKVTDMSGMFAHTKAFDQPLDSWDTSNVTDMSWMFHDAKSFNQPLNSWDVSHVTSMYWMFDGARAFNQPLDSWNVSHVTNMSRMFAYAESFNHPLDSWNVSHVTDMGWVFGASGIDTKNYDATLQGWAKQLPMEPRTLSAEGLTYCKAAKARQKLIDAGWVVYGDSKKCA